MTRDALEALEAQLDRAVDRVSLPRVAGLLARDAARGYRLPGYGVVFVLTPRALPGDGRNVLVHVTPRRHTGPRAQRSAAPDEDEPAGDRDARAARDHPAERDRAGAPGRRAGHGAHRPRPADASHRTGRDAGSAAGLGRGSADSTSGERRAATAEAAPRNPAGAGRGAAAAATAVEVLVRERRDPRRAHAPGDDRRRATRRSSRPSRATRRACRGCGRRSTSRSPSTSSCPTRSPRTHAPSARCVVRARVADIEARARAAIGPDEFRRRVEVIEY